MFQVLPEAGRRAWEHRPGPPGQRWDRDRGRSLFIPSCLGPINTRRPFKDPSRVISNGFLLSLLFLPASRTRFFCFRQTACAPQRSECCFPHLGLLHVHSQCTLYKPQSSKVRKKFGSVFPSQCRVCHSPLPETPGSSPRFCPGDAACFCPRSPARTLRSYAPARNTHLGREGFARQWCRTNRADAPKNGVPADLGRWRGLGSRIFKRERVSRSFVQPATRRRWADQRNATTSLVRG